MFENQILERYFLPWSNCWKLVGFDQSIITLCKEPSFGGNAMKGVVFPGNRKLEIMDFQDPTPGPGEVVWKSKRPECAEAISNFTVQTEELPHWDWEN